ncbi:transcriptional regulator, TetR family [Methylocella silvestris BL2]|uniref:Transcriptional regulator, TetR family n=1 Tax=Methylocella silvestris (strain DSM 15510 / CIP 108128 / LMG 27833 / NCIMB 13906 / BL2) TaxID=395965 RepID=B8ENM9_METSB|nr:CerR family C-terminal domain-containing protein [Methylocella silvestris]ACK50815.1 transcriptional regulator, TetR family [Methylocella silvestris BL2]
MKIADLTRQALLAHAAVAFAENGFERAAVREITRRAAVNQAAINYHFGGKEALYREVLRLAFAALREASLLDEETVDRVGREEAVRLFIRQQVTALEKHDQLSRYLRILAWETLAPTPIYLDFIASAELPMLDQAEKIVRRFLPAGAPRAEITIATIWLTQQVAPFIRHYDMLSQPPLNLTIDRRFIEQLAADVGRMAVAGLNARTTAAGADSAYEAQMA